MNRHTNHQSCSHKRCSIPSAKHVSSSQTIFVQKISIFNHFIAFAYFGTISTVAKLNLFSQSKYRNFFSRDSWKNVTEKEKKSVNHLVELRYFIVNQKFKSIFGSIFHICQEYKISIRSNQMDHVFNMKSTQIK